MNPVAAVDAASLDVSPTLQALAERLMQPPVDAGAGLGVALAEGSIATAPVADAHEVAALLQQQGRWDSARPAQALQAQAGEVGSLARSAGDLSTAATALGGPAVLAWAHADPAGSARAVADIAAVPVLMHPMLPSDAPRAARPDSAAAPQTRRAALVQAEDEQHEDADAEAEATEPTELEPEDTADIGAGSPEHWRRRLEQHAAPELLRELQLGRAVLLVLPQAPGAGSAARVLLLGATSATAFKPGRWWPGLGNTAPWPHWRVFRGGDPLHEPELRSRAGPAPCRVLLGAGTPQAAHADRAEALLLLPERLRFARALKGQWSLLVVAAPLPGA